MTVLDDNPLLRQLQWVHTMLRRDLADVRRLAAEAASGAPTTDVRAGLSRLQSHGPLFQLRVNCLNYCNLVHHHHGNEDVALFPAVRRTAPELSAAVDRLESDHRVVSDLLDEVESTAATLDEAAGRERLVKALETLSTHLLEHLAFEEESLGPVLKTWRNWPID